MVRSCAPISPRRWSLTPAFTDPTAKFSTTARRDVEIAGRVSLRLPFILSVIAGSTDTIVFLGMSGLFTAHITGNLVFLAAHTIAGDPAVLSYLLAVPMYILVLLLTSVLASRLERWGFETLRPLLSLELLLLAVVFFSTFRARFDTNSLPAVTLGMCGVAAMAVQTALVQIALPKTPSTTAMTTNVTKLVIAVVQLMEGGDPITREQARSSGLQLTSVIVGFVMGCGLGAAACATWGLKSLGVPAMLLLLSIGLCSPPPDGK